MGGADVVAGGQVSNGPRDFENAVPGAGRQVELGRRLLQQLVAGGVGLAPMKSIIQYALEKKLPRTIYLFYGARTLSFLYDHDVFVALAAQHPNFRYVPALSDVGPDDPWAGERGFIHQIVQRVFPEGEPAEAYLCGPPIMIQLLTPVLREKGITEKDTYYDEF